MTFWYGFWSRGLIAPIFWKTLQVILLLWIRTISYNDIWFSLVAFGRAGDGYGLEHGHLNKTVQHAILPETRLLFWGKSFRNYFVAWESKLATTDLRPNPTRLFYGVMLSRKFMRMNFMISPNSNKESEEWWENLTTKCMSTSSEVLLTSKMPVKLEGGLYA